MTDEELLEQIQSGKQYALSALYERYVEAIHRFFWYQFHDNELAEDLTQDTWVEVIYAIPGFSHKGSVKNWLYAIAKRQAYHYLAKQYKLAVEALPDWIPEDSSLIDSDEEKQHEANRERLRRLLHTLSPEERKIVKMVKLQGHTSKEVAAVTGTTPISIRVRLSRILSKLKKK